MEDPENIKERMEPRIELDADLEVSEPLNGPPRKTRPGPEKKPITRWVIGPILAAALAGLAYAFWVVWSLEPAATKSPNLSAEVLGLKGEVQKLAPELEKLKKELEELKIENKTTVDQLKGLQAQLTAWSKKIETVPVKKTEPATIPAKRAEMEPAKKSEWGPSKKPPTTPVKKPVGKTFVYQVRPGDTVHSIGRKFGVDPQEIVRLNDLPPKGGLQTGQLLTIHPGSSK